MHSTILTRGTRFILAVTRCVQHTDMGRAVRDASPLCCPCAQPSTQLPPATGANAPFGAPPGMPSFSGFTQSSGISRAPIMVPATQPTGFSGGPLPSGHSVSAPLQAQQPPQSLPPPGQGLPPPPVGLVGALERWAAVLHQGCTPVPTSVRMHAGSAADACRLSHLPTQQGVPPRPLYPTAPPPFMPQGIARAGAALLPPGPPLLTPPRPSNHQQWPGQRGQQRPTGRCDTAQRLLSCI